MQKLPTDTDFSILYLFLSLPGDDETILYTSLPFVFSFLWPYYFASVIIILVLLDCKIIFLSLILLFQQLLYFLNFLHCVFLIHYLSLWIFLLHFIFIFLHIWFLCLLCIWILVFLLLCPFLICQDQIFIFPYIFTLHFFNSY